MKRVLLVILAAAAGLFGCSTTVEHGTLAELEAVAPDTEEILLEDSLEKAAESYRRYLAETSGSARTPEAMRRLADLQIEQEYGIVGGAKTVEMAAPEAGQSVALIGAERQANEASMPSESEQDFEDRATRQSIIQSQATTLDGGLPDGTDSAIPLGPREAIATYWEILERYPNYERNDQVLYQLSRAYDEIGEPDKAMEVMDRFVSEYPHSRYVDEVYFRRGEFYFVRKKYLDAEDAYGEILRLGASSSYYELALYKLGWSLYKQEMYEEALHNYIAMLDHRQAIGYDFETAEVEDDEHRVADTFRVISLSFSNLGGPDVVDEYFTERGHRAYADKIYGNLAEFYFDKMRYEDAASVYKSYIALNPYHRISPHFGMRIVEIYAEAGFPLLVVEAKKTFATDYAVNSLYWGQHDIAASPEVVGFLKTNLTDLAGHYHALYQEESLVDAQAENFGEALHWYRAFLVSFPQESESPQINYQLADLLLENTEFGQAALEYERTAYDYPPHEQSAAAGYAAIYSHREHLAATGEENEASVRQATVASSLRFANTFPEHEQAPVVLGNAADDLYVMHEFEQAISSAQLLIERYPTSDAALRRDAWTVVAHSSIDLSLFQQAEEAYLNVLDLTPDDDESRAAIVDGLAAAIYKQGEQSNEAGDYLAAADHFLRIKRLAPTSAIRSSAEYDAAAALMQLENWARASEVLESFRAEHTDHALNTEATKQLAHIYREDGQIERSAAEHERIYAEAEDPVIMREALLTAGELYDEASVFSDAIRVYESYVVAYPAPLDIAMETRSRLAEIFKTENDIVRYHDALREIVIVDRDAGADRTDRSRFLAANAALVLAGLEYESFAGISLTQPFEQSLAEKQARMDAALEAFERLVDYEVALVTAAATYYIAEIYMDFSASLLESERPAGLTDAEKVDYELVIEEEAFPFEERSIEVHQENFELLAAGIYNDWVQKSLDKLAVFMPGRYAKNEISGGYVGSIDSYAYRMPIAPPIGIDGEENVEVSGQAETVGPAPTTAQISRDVADAGQER